MAIAFSGCLKSVKATQPLGFKLARKVPCPFGADFSLGSASLRVLSELFTCLAGLLRVGTGLPWALVQNFQQLRSTARAQKGTCLGESFGGQSGQVRFRFVGVLCHSKNIWTNSRNI